MQNDLEKYANGRKWLIGSVIILALLIGLLCVKYYQYAYALSWHCLHGSYAQIGGHRVELPLLWWKADAQAYDTVNLVRAGVANTYLKPEIVVSPAFPGAIRDSDQEELQAMQAAISRSHESPGGESSSLVVISTKALTMYCQRKDIIASGVSISTNLFCTAAKVQYAFTYNGPPNRVKEAQAIFSTLE